jgi:hypothetical protein
LSLTELAISETDIDDLCVSEKDIRLEAGCRELKKAGALKR